MVFTLSWNFQQEVFIINQKHLFLYGHSWRQRLLNWLLGNLSEIGDGEGDGGAGHCTRAKQGKFNFMCFICFTSGYNFLCKMIPQLENIENQTSLFYSRHIFLKSLHSPQKAGFHCHKETINWGISPQVFAGYVVMCGKFYPHS